MQRFLVLIYLVGFLAATLHGCSGPAGPEMVPVSGTVSYQGKPVEQGRIAFIPDTTELGAGAPYAVEIVAGKFQGECTPGEKKVEIYGSWKTGKMLEMDDGSGQTPEWDSIPARHNDQSTLKVTLQEEPNTEMKFDLE